MNDRKYVMVRVTAGDYIVAGNDGKDIWRFTRYQDGAAHGLDVDYELRDFWMARSTPMPPDEEIAAYELDLVQWTEHASMLRTRAEAEAVMVDRTTPVMLEWSLEDAR